jgi:SsrA-binding protein
MSSKKHASGNLAANRKAFHEYIVLEKLEAGIELRGTEVKSVKSGSASLAGGFAREENGQLWLHNVSIPPYEQGNRFNHEPTRPRRLLLHRKEIDRLAAQSQQKGCALIPLGLHLHRGLIKVELGICKGKTLGDKRETLRRKTAERETRRAMAAHV